MYQMALQDLPKFTQIGILCLKMYHLATLVWYILLSCGKFGIFCGRVIYFSRFGMFGMFWYILVCCPKKTLATLLDSRSGFLCTWSENADSGFIRRMLFSQIMFDHGGYFGSGLPDFSWSKQIKLGLIYQITTNYNKRP
jgi:hypothetical protein